MKKLASLLGFLFLFAIQPAKAQYNPYLDKKKKNKPSAVMARETKRDLRKQKKMAKKQMRRSKRHLNRKKR
jgi:hypothetical protein